MTGRQLADEVTRRRPGTKTLYTSGYTENAIIHHGRLDHGVMLLSKPYRKSALASMVRLALEKSATVNCDPEALLLADTSIVAMQLRPASVQAASLR
jgi:hypothetical protein